MRRILREAMQAGAIGFSTSRQPAHQGAYGRPVPSRFADNDEIYALAGVLGELGKGVVQVSIGPGMFVDQFSDLAVRTGVPITWTALVARADKPGAALRTVERGGALPGEVYPQIACRPIVMQISMADPVPLAEIDEWKDVLARPRAERADLYRDPSWRERARPATLAAWSHRWPKTSVEETLAHPDTVGVPLDQLASRRGTTPFDLMLDLALSDGMGTRYRIVLDNDGDEEVGDLLADKRTLLGLSDAGAHANQLCDACYSTHLLGHWVRERKAISLEDAVWRLTGHPAKAFRIADRGVVREGAFADLVAFDPATVGTTPVERVRDQPGGADRLHRAQHGYRAHLGQRRRHAHRRSGRPGGRSGAPAALLSGAGPLAGLRVVEVALGLSAVGAGLATSLPGRLLADLGADVTRVRTRRRPTLDAGVEFERVWDRDKEIVEVDEGAPAGTAATVLALAREADVLLLAGGEDRIEQQGVHYPRLRRDNPRLVVVRLRPSYHARGTVPDLELLVGARTGLLTQIRGHRPGPVFADLAVAGAGAALSATAGTLARLYEREGTGLGGWVETSLYDGLRALLPMILGRVEHPSPTTTLLWRDQGPAESLCYRCGDGGYVQLWFGARGAYEEFLESMDEPPSEGGYHAELMSGAMVERGRRWSETFATRPRDEWLAALAGHNFRCEPVLRPGEALRDPHVRELGLARQHRDGRRGPITLLGPTLTVDPAGDGRTSARPAGDEPAAGLLSGVRVLDLSAYLAGPAAALVLAELGADVVKVEPVTGDVHRGMEPMFAAGQRGKRALALDLKSPQAPAVLERLFRWSDVVHHNSRVGLADRLGYDERSVRAANPDVVYSFASGFGEGGPRAALPANDQLMQALSGIEAAQAGAGRPPTFLVWGAVDVTGGWMAACGVLAGLYARRRGGGGQTVASSLLGAALTLKSGAFLAADRPVEGPLLDAHQTGYGAAYRIYQGGDGRWFALAIPDERAWEALRRVVPVDGLSAQPPPLRIAPTGAQPDELLLEAAFRSRDAAGWVSDLAAAGIPAEPVVEADRSAFVAGFVDDPVNRTLGRVVSYSWGERGHTEQPSFPPALGPTRPAGAFPGVPGLGEHTGEVLAEAGLDAAQLAALIASGAVRAG